MDPNANLKEQRELVKVLLYGERCDRDVDNAIALAMLVEALDEWLSKDGALPHDWQCLVAEKKE